MKRFLDQEIKKNGFVKVKSEWHKKLTETTIVVNWQKSNYSPLYYINVGVAVNKFYENGELPVYSTSQCLGLIGLISSPEEQEAQNKFLSDYKEIADEFVLREKIKTLIMSPIQRFTNGCNTIEELELFIFTKAPKLLNFVMPCLKELFKQQQL